MDRWGSALSMLYLGEVFKSIGEINEAQEYYRSSLNIFREIEYQRGIARTLNRIGELMLDSEGSKKAEEFFNESLKIFTEIHDPVGRIRSRNNIGLIQLEGGETLESTEMFKENLSKAMQMGHVEIINETLVHIVSVCIRETEPDFFKSVALLAYVYNRQEIRHSYRERIAGRMEELKARLDEEAYRKAVDYGKTLTLEDVSKIVFNEKDSETET